MDEGADVPFSCKGAVCCTCKAKVIEGKAIMDENYSLSEKEVAAGFILTCQAHPITENIVVDFDEM
jgi:ring-1,2-phenylacetyl-CoA epoxidase subunit PaaE